MPTPNYETCTACSKQVYNLMAKGLCAACYQRQWKRGTTDYAPPRERKPCSVDGCTEMSAAHGYCSAHYARWRKHGVAEHERFDRWGHVSKHPLAHSYYWARKTDGVLFHEPWRKDFWQFVRDIGDRPSPEHKLRKVDQAMPLGPNNFAWVPPKFDGLRHKDDPRAYRKAFAAGNSRVRKASVLRKLYGITMEQYDAMIDAQGGLCAICEKPEETINYRTGFPRDLGVDHCHGRGHVRALLCSQCNSALGNFNDDPVLIRKALAYLEKHSLPTASE